MAEAHSGTMSLTFSSLFRSTEHKAGPKNNETETRLDYPHASEEQLIAAAKSCDQQAFLELSGRCTSLVYKRVCRILQNREDAEDVIQETLLNAYRHLPEFRGSCSFSTWLTRIAINTAFMVLRRKRVRSEVSLDQPRDTDQRCETWDLPDIAPDAERRYATEQTIQFMSKAVDQLAPIYRSVVEQCHLEEKSVKQAADSLGITVAAVKSRLFRARLTVRSMLEERRISMGDVCY